MKLTKKLSKNSKSNKYNHIFILKKAETIADKVVLLSDQIIEKEDNPHYLVKAKEWKKALSEGKNLDDILVEVFAYARVAIRQIYKMSLFRVQVMGAYALHKGDIAQMRTGEGKTITAVLPALLNALEGKGVHIITVNEYLVQRDAFNTSKIFSLFGLSTGVILKDFDAAKKREEYGKDITYITHSEVGFDYLRDNMVRTIKDKTQRGFNYCIIDEADSILIDEAKTPLIMAAPSNIPPKEYEDADDFVITLDEDDYEIDMERKIAFLTEAGVKKAEENFNLENLYDHQNSLIVHRIANALQAHNIFHYDVDYTVKEGEIVLIDTFTGRFLEGRTYSEGLHQAIEAKEKVKIKPENQTIASITYQNFFRSYKKISGMTGTAVTEEEEFMNIYNTRVIVIPTNKPVIRKDHPDLVFASKKAKFDAVSDFVEEIHETGQPILVGTRSVEDSEYLAEILDKRDLIFEILNAKNNSREAQIVANSGKEFAITISTNMAGRGTDIKLDEGVPELGGLYVIGTERHESRRIDDQLRGRSGRQGDVGSSQFFVSLEDEVMVRSGLKRFKKLMGNLDSTPIKSRMMTRGLTTAQKKLEAINFDSRKSVIEYDDVMNRQRIMTYRGRDKILKQKEISDFINKVIKTYVVKLFEHETLIKTNENIDLSKLNNRLMPLGLMFTKEEAQSEKELEKLVMKRILLLHYESSESLSDEIRNQYYRVQILGVIDMLWQEQINQLNKLKVGIRYRQYAQKNPIQAYLHEADNMFYDYKFDIIERTVFIGCIRLSNDSDSFEIKLEGNGEKESEMLTVQ